MTQEPETRSVVIERDMQQAPDKVWRALTQQPLIAEWLMNNDFKPEVGHNFKFTADWGSVDGRVVTVEPNKQLSYTWGAFGLESLVTWTLTPTDSGTHVRMEHAGFPREQEQAYQGAKGGWKRFLDALEGVVAKLG